MQQLTDEQRLQLMQDAYIKEHNISELARIGVYKDTEPLDIIDGLYKTNMVTPRKLAEAIAKREGWTI